MPQKPLMVVGLMLRIFNILQSSQSDRSASACNEADSLLSRAGTVTCVRLSAREQQFALYLPVVCISLTALSSARLRDALSIFTPAAG